MNRSEIIDEIKARIKNYDKDIKAAADSKNWMSAHDLTTMRNTLSNLLATLIM